ncbi:uncharacterized protein LOC134257922 [Saccostrea cucullata]|uniref:uncharacterized protein LOC134257922 n=1 Tax=Saccostrea cuccullata TaxID=36930 RepID=UPI002ED62B97
MNANNDEHGNTGMEKLVLKNENSLQSNSSSGSSGYSACSRVPSLEELQQDEFVSVETFEREGIDEPNILRSIVQTEEINEIHKVEDYVEKLKTSKPHQRTDIIKLIQTELLPHLKANDDIRNLSTLLTCGDEDIQSITLKSLKSILLTLEIGMVEIQSLESCLQNILVLMMSDETSQVLWFSICPVVLRVIAFVSIQFCYVKSERKKTSEIMSPIVAHLKDYAEKLTKHWHKENTKVHKTIHCIVHFLSKFEKFKMSETLIKILGNWEDAFSTKDSDKDLAKLRIHEQYIFAFGLISKMARSPSLFRCNFIQFLRATYCCPHRLVERKWHEELFHSLTELLLTGVADVFNKVDEKSEDFQTLLEVLKVSSQGFHAKWSFLPIPEEVHDLLFTLGHPVLQLVVKALDLSETMIRELAEANIKNTVPGLHIHDKVREIFSKTDERNYWSICGGRLYHFNVTISILIPDISTLKNTDHTEEAKSKHVRKTNEFEILLSMQKDYRHTCNSIAKLLAYGSSSLPLPFYVVENHPQGLLERLLEARRSHKWLPRSWMYERLQEMASCFTYLHSQRIVHRDITLHSFCLKTCLTSGKCMAVLQKLELAHSTTNTSSSTHISVISGDWIPIRWSAPESILHGKYDSKTDVWMFGHTIHEMFTYGCEPYTELYSENTEEVIIRVVTRRLKPYKWKCIPHSFHILSTKCYDIHPEKRPPMHVVEKHIQTLRDQSCPGSLDIGGNSVPHIGDKQLKREHKPERGIPNVVNFLREKTTENPEEFETCYKTLRSSIYGRNKSLEFNLRKEDLESREEFKITNEINCIIVEELVSDTFFNLMLPKLSGTLAENLGLKECAVKKIRRCSSSTDAKMIIQYTFPSSSNILCIAEEMSKNSKEENVNTLLRFLFAVVKHVKQIHSRKWLMVDLIGKYVFIIDKQEMPKALMIRIGRMQSLPQECNIQEYSIIVNQDLQDMLYWLPKEVIGHNELSCGSDVYTMAMLFYEVFSVLSGRERLDCVPFGNKHKSKLLEHLNEGQVPEKPDLCPSWLYDEVMLKCWDLDRTCRPHVDEIISLFSSKLDLSDAPLSSASGSISSYKGFDESNSNRGDGYLDVTHSSDSPHTHNDYHNPLEDEEEHYDLIDENLLQTVHL